MKTFFVYIDEGISPLEILASNLRDALEQARDWCKNFEINPRTIRVEGQQYK